jgi:predicted dehydrogenase
MDTESLSRRSFLKRSTAAGAGASAFTIVRPELVRGAGREKLKAGLIGVGGRGAQAVENVLTGCPNVEVTAMADIFEDHLERQLKRLTGHQNPSISSRVKVDAEHRFLGFEAYKKVIASDVDIVMLCTPPGYRPEHFEAAVNAKKHVFCEKPFGTDPVGVRRFMAAAKKSEELKLSVKSGAQRRSQQSYLERYKRVRDGEIGDILACYAYWVGGPVIQQKSRNPQWGDMEWQHRAWYSFVWICGDQIVEQHLHNIDVCNWFMGAHPVSVVASGGAAWRPKEEIYGNIYDHIAADFVYPNGVRMSSYCRQYPRGSATNISELIVGAKGKIDTKGLGSGTGLNPYVQEHIDLVNSILGTGPYVNEAMTVAESTMTCVMGREAAYSGQEITWDMAMNSKLDLQPKAFDYSLKMDVPPLPVPGEYKFI